MGNADLVIVFNNGEVSFLINGIDYNTRENAILNGLDKWQEYKNTTYGMADRPEELFFEIKSINIYEIWR